MKKKRISIDIGPEAQIAYSMAFNAFSIRAIGEIIIFAFILLDYNTKRPPFAIEIFNSL